MISHYANDSASVEWIRECASVETGRDELEPHQIESLSGRSWPGEKSACLPADDRGIAEARSSEGGNGGTECAPVSIQSREPAGSNSAPVGRASLELQTAKGVDPTSIDSREAYIGFTFGGYLTADAIDAEVEIVEHHRAFYREFDGAVLITRIEHNDARAGRPPLWVPCQFPYYIARTIAQQIEREIEYERVTGDAEPYTAEACGTREYGEI